MKVKMIAVDLDGTLLNDNQRVSEKTIETMAKVKAQGVKIAVSTGRSYSACKFYANQIKADYIVCCNGAIVMDTVEQNVIYKRPMNQQVAHEVIEILYKYKHNLKIQWDSFDTYYSNNLLPFETDYIEAYKSEYPDEDFKMKVIESVEDNLHIVHNEDIYQIFTYSMQKDMGAYQDIMKKLRKFKDIHYVDFKEHYTDITHIDVNKGAALKKVAVLNEIKSEQIIAFGDNHNDRTMLEYAGISVAMKNANEEIRSISKHIASTNNEEGVEKFLREYFRT